MKKVLVTGAKGMLGSDLCQILRQRDYEVVITDIGEMDVRNRTQVRATMQAVEPDWVIHLAAMTDVDACERDPDESFRSNTIATQNVALACQEMDVLMTYVSTISVFDGTSAVPYTEFDTPNPQSWYSRSKYQGEHIVEKLLNRYYIVRAGWMFGGGPEDKKFVAKIMELAMQRDKLTVVDDKFGSPTYTHDIGTGIVNIADTGLYGTYHMVNTGGYCSRFEFSKKILELAGITTCEIEPVNSARFPLAAPRPRMEAALNYNLELRDMNWMRPWQAALEDYIQTVLLGNRVSMNGHQTVR
ncbi:MAG TPA: dTDP-4-dehydrorhamnose reductase [Caldilineaceae bacterium]|nr:dTDP-4-dehydrorhamnose reductase [Caldilineaceae bacterium]